MQSDNIYIQQLKDNLKELNPYLVLLFGSYAYGTPHEDSDIDLLVVTNDVFTPNDFNEHSQLYLKVSKAIRPIKKQIAVDLIVHTLPMYQKFIELNSLFASEIITKGKIIYESNHTKVA
jgi:predicted nucleotidyltransferase